MTGHDLPLSIDSRTRKGHPCPRVFGIGAASEIINRDSIGVGVGWGSPTDKSLRDQVTSEVFYRIEVTQQLAITPDLQITYKPSFNLVKDWVLIAGIRFRVVF